MDDKLRICTVCQIGDLLYLKIQGSEETWIKYLILDVSPHMPPPEFMGLPDDVYWNVLCLEDNTKHLIYTSALLSKRLMQIFRDGKKIWPTGTLSKTKNKKVCPQEK